MWASMHHSTIQAWKGIEEKADEVKRTKAYITYDEICRILSQITYQDIFCCVLQQRGVPLPCTSPFLLISGSATCYQVCKWRKETLVKQVRFYEVATAGARKSSLVLQKQVPRMVGMAAVE
jgi:hypothetical protein